MEVSNNNKLTFQSSVPPRGNLNNVGAMSDKEIDRAAIRIAYEDNKDRFKHTHTLRNAILVGIPSAAVVLSAAAKGDKELTMAARTKNGLKTAGVLGAYFALASVFFGLVRHAVNQSPDAKKQVKDHNVSYVAASLLGAFLIVPKVADYAIEKAGNLAKRVQGKFDPENSIGKSVRNVVSENINKLKGGRIEGALDSIDNFLKKDIVAGKNGAYVAEAAMWAALVGYVAKSFIDIRKFNKDVKQNKETLSDLRASSNEIKTLKEESETTKELAELEQQDARDAMNIIVSILNVNNADANSASLSNSDSRSNTVNLLSKANNTDKELPVEFETKSEAESQADASSEANTSDEQIYATELDTSEEEPTVKNSESSGDEDVSTSKSESDETASKSLDIEE